MIASLPTSRCERLNLVAICTARSSPRMRREALLRVRHGDGEIAAEADQDLRSAVDGSPRMAATASCPWRAAARTEGRFDAVEHSRARLLGDADRAIALHVGMAAQRADAGARLADIAAQQQQIGDLLDIAGAMAVLGDAHAVGDDRRVGLRIDARRPPRVRRAASLMRLRSPPSEVASRSATRPRSRGMFGDEVVIEHRRVCGGIRVEREQRLHDALEHRGVAADLHLIVGGSDRRIAEGRHLDRVLRIG